MCELLLVGVGLETELCHISMGNLCNFRVPDIWGQTLFRLTSFKQIFYFSIWHLSHIKKTFLLIATTIKFL